MQRWKAMQVINKTFAFFYSDPLSLIDYTQCLHKCCSQILMFAAVNSRFCLLLCLYSMNNVHLFCFFWLYHYNVPCQYGNYSMRLVQIPVLYIHCSLHIPGEYLYSYRTGMSTEDFLESI